MQRDPYSTFLHTDAWQIHLHGERDAAGNVWSKKSLPLGNHYWQTSRAFIPEKWEIPDFSTDGMFIRIEPDTEESAHNLSKITGFKQIVRGHLQPPQTLVVDLIQSEEDLLNSFKSKHRYNIKVAQKHGLAVRIETTNLSQHFTDLLWPLIRATSGRHGISNHAHDHYLSILKAEEPVGGAAIALIESAGKVIAGALIILNHPFATYLHGGSNYGDRALMAPHLLHWEIMMWLKSQNYSHYDLWGVRLGSDGEPLPNHPSTGTTRFKIGFGGIKLSYLETHTLVVRPGKFALYSIVTWLKNSLKRRKKFSD